MPDSSNPLSKYFRTPKIYIKLPSEGKWYPEGAYDQTPTGEIPVYGMTAKDELLLKTPDALFSGQSTVDVIQSCVPNIKNAWAMPSVDVDAVLIAIRQATYGNEMEFTSVCPHCESKNESAIDLGVLANRIVAPDYSERFKMQGLEFIFRPNTFKDINDESQQSYQQQKILSIVIDENLSEADKSARFSKLFTDLLDITVQQVASSIAGIKTEDGSMVQDPVYIHDFFKNCEKPMWEAVKAHLEKIVKTMATRNIDLTCDNEECQKTYTSPLLFEQSSFFG